MTTDTRERRIGPSDWREAVEDVDGPQLVVAGPGTGKTQFLVDRAVHLITDREVAAGSVLMLTFSRRAAADLRERVETALSAAGLAQPTAGPGAAASTFHSLAYRLLETHSHGVLGWSEMPSLLTGPEQVALVAELLSGEDERSWPVGFRSLLRTRTFADEVADFILRSQEYLVDDEALAARVDGPGGRADWRGLPEFRRRYLDELKARHRIDYGTLQAQAVRLLEDCGVRDAIAEQYRYVLADEYQDTTAAQARLLHHVTAIRRRITAAADPYQSVYSFRGAELSNVAEFPDLFTDEEGRPARRVVLTTSFRVPAAILSAAERITAGGDLPGAAGPVHPAEHAGAVDAYLFSQQSEEAEWIASEIQRLHLTRATPYSAMAVLVRSKRRFLPELSRSLQRRGIAHDSPDARLVDHPAVRLVFDCAVAACAASAPPGTGLGAEGDRAMRRVLLGPLFGLALGAERELLRARHTSGSPWSTVLTAGMPEAGELVGLLRDPAWASDVPAGDGFWSLWSSLPQFGTLVSDESRRDFRAAWTALAQALERQRERDPSVSLVDYARLADQDDFEAVPLLSYRESGVDRLTLTTLHQAKGLEFDIVFIADAVEQVFPDLRRSRSLLQPRLLGPQPLHDPAVATRARLQEEMRLAYTAMSRARSRVVWTATSAGIDETDRRPSRFLRIVADGEVGPPADRAGAPPLTYLDAEAHFRRLATDPEAPGAARLAATTVLAERPNPGLRDARQFAFVRVRGPDAGLVPEDVALSPSQATAYDECPRRYAFERRLGVERDFGLYATFGSLIHEVLERAEGDAIAAGRDRSTLEEALAVLEEVWDSYDFEAGARRQAWKRRATGLLDDLYAHWIRPGAVPVLVEHPLEMRIDGVLWRGRADRIERAESGSLRVVDYKTSKTTPTIVEAENSLQLAFYLAAARDDPAVTRHGEPTEAEFWYPLAKKRSHPLDPDRLHDLVDRLAAIADGIRREDWRPKAGGHCDKCSVRAVCPLWPEGREAFTR